MSQNNPKYTWSDEDVFLWANGSWCFRDELDCMGHLSDDYTVLVVDTPEWRKHFEEIEADFQEQKELLDAIY